MNRQERQALIVSLLRSATEPMRGEDLADQAQVTRQVVVHEIALLRAAGVPILSTPRGYRLSSLDYPSRERTIIAVRHTPEQTAEELYTLVDHGLAVHSVIVAHPIYGHLEGSLEIRSRIDVASFLQQVEADQASLLSSLTDGYHMHTVSFQRSKDLELARQALRRAGIAVLD
ncbi:transcription repressor NadR [Sulfobacillus harzensis]|uniref:Transcription repressor NadR n=1 Tax=Sulfobacillus harzensis TaxID=2729629 RepID=A0A7Y0Q5Y1_9FIRM|nr:transcription repressor NadR [Sulfobacillus harzensis]NMP24784.1 transcription repressor NadR [Sulfobacillus harzensis]